MSMMGEDGVMIVTSGRLGFEDVPGRSAGRSFYRAQRLAIYRGAKVCRWGSLSRASQLRCWSRSCDAVLGVSERAKLLVAMLLLFGLGGSKGVACWFLAEISGRRVVVVVGVCDAI